MDTHHKTDNGFFLIRNNDMAPLLNSFSSLCQERVLHDVTLACSDGKMQSSRAVLALAYSPLEEVLKNREEDILVLIMPDFSQVEIRQLLETMLLGNTVSTNVEANKDYSQEGLIKGEQTKVDANQDTFDNSLINSKEKLKVDDMRIIEAKEEIQLNTEEKLTEVSLKFEIDKESHKTVWNGVENIKEEKHSSIKKETGKNVRITSKILSCTICIYKTIYNSHFEQHMLRKHSEREGRLVCTRPWCEDTFNTKHEREQHKKICLLICGVCGKKFDRQDHLNRHMRAEANKALQVAAQSKWQRYAP